MAEHERTCDQLLDDLTAMTQARDRLEAMASRALGERDEARAEVERLRGALREAAGALAVAAATAAEHAAHDTSHERS